MIASFGPLLTVKSVRQNALVRAAMLRRGRSPASRLVSRVWRRTAASNAPVGKAAIDLPEFGIHLGGGESSSRSFFSRHAVPLGLWTAVSLNVGAFFSQGDEGLQVLIHLGEKFSAPILDPETPSDRLKERLERVVRRRAPPAPLA